MIRARFEPFHGLLQQTGNVKGLHFLLINFVGSVCKGIVQNNHQEHLSRFDQHFWLRLAVYAGSMDAGST